MKPRSCSVVGMVVMLAASGIAPVQAQSVETARPVPAHKTVAFNPNTPDRCDWFFITESNVSITRLSNPVESGDKLLINDSFGLMKQVGARAAVGASIDFIAAQDLHYAPTLRYKRWYGSRSVDLTLGYVPGELAGPTGPIVAARFSPARLLHIQVGACQYREFHDHFESYGYSYTYSLDEQKKMHGFIGIGFGGAAGAALWGVQAIAVGAAASAYSGL